MERFTIFLVALFVLVLFSSLPVYAAQFKAGDEVNIRQEKVIDDDLYLFAGVVTVDGTVKGDLLVWAGNVTINGNVTGDVVAGGGTVIINGAVGDDLYVMGGMVTVNDKVSSDVMATGGSVTFGSDAGIGRDLITAAGNVVVRGDVGRKLTIRAGNVQLADRVGGKAVINADTLRLSSDARLDGDLTYTSPNKLVMEEGAEVAGKIKHREPPKPEAPEIPAFLAPLGVFGVMIAYVLGLILSILFALVSLFVVGMVIALFFPNTTKMVSDRVFATPWPCFGYGFAVLFLTPVLIIILMATVIGIPLALILLALFGIAAYIAKVFVCIHIGEKTIWLFDKEAKPALGWSLLLGIVLYIIIGFIPVIGGLVKFAVLLAGLGAMTCVILSYYREPFESLAVKSQSVVPPGTAGAVSEAISAVDKIAEKAVKAKRKPKTPSSVKPKK